MEKIVHLILKAFRKVFQHIVPEKNTRPSCEHNPEVAYKKILELLQSDDPVLITRFGSTELSTVINYLGVKYHKRKYLNYILGKTPQWWWQTSMMQQMLKWSGFFPPTHVKIEAFCELFLTDIKDINLLGSWLIGENYFNEELKDIDKLFLLLLEPFWSKEPWTKVLEGKKVLVVHPFAKTIEKQYKKRETLHKKEILPEFELKTIKAVQSIAGEETPFEDWFEALDFMKDQINKTDFDICLIGAGAYGFPLAAYVKRLGKKAVHIGGSIQLLFGIRGKRWEVPVYEAGYDYLNLITDSWVKPSEDETPRNASTVENGCYW